MDIDLGQFHSESPEPARSGGAPPDLSPPPSPPAPLPMPRLVTRPVFDSSLAFAEETVEAPPAPPAPAAFNNSRRDVGVLLRSRRGIAIAVCVAGAVAAAVPLWKALHRSPDLQASAAAVAPVVGATGSATFESNPSGQAVSIGGDVRGTTPLKISLPVGEHAVEIGSDPAKRQLIATITADTASSYYVELPSAPVEAAAVGGLDITSDPVGALVSLDGYRRGVTPLSLAGVAAGDHRVTLTQDGTAVNRTVRITAGATSSVVVSIRVPAAVAGWVAISAPFEMKIFENGALIGTTSTKSLMMPAGAHTFELVNEELEFTTTVPMQVLADKTATANVAVPKGSLSVNAVPWAEVLIDGEDVGVTPLGNLAIAVGPHEVTWRHPQFGERRRSVIVKGKAPARIGVDFNQP